LANGLPYQAWAAERVAATRATDRVNDPLPHCLPIGPVRSHAITFYREIVQLPHKLIFLNEYNSSYRQVFTDGRPLPVDPVPTLNGYSSGRWEGDELVIETIGFLDNAVWLDNFGSPLTDAAKVTETFRRRTFGELEIELTVDDPKAYSEPWTVTLVQKLVPDTELAEASCAEEALVSLIQGASD
jgi:hypothetical protein